MTGDGRRSMPTARQLSIWREYIETTELLRSRLVGRLQQDSGLAWGDYQVLLALTERSTMRSSELADLIGWERSRLSHHLGRMEKRGLIRRRPCVDVAHGIDVTATDAGAAAFRAGTVPHLRVVRELFLDALTPAQLDEIAGITANLRRHLDAEPWTDDADPSSEGAGPSSEGAG